MRKQLDLLPVQSDDTNLLFFDTTADESLGKLVHELSFDLVLYKVTDTGVIAWYPVRVYEYGFGAATPLVRRELEVEETYLGLSRYSSQHETRSHLSPALTWTSSINQ